VFCPQCGVQNADDHSFCVGCGAALRTGAAVAGGPPSGSAARPAPPPPPPPGAAPPTPFVPQQPYGTIPPARKTNVLAIAMFALVMLAVGGAGAYLILKGDIAWPFGQVAMQTYADPKGGFKIRYPRGWTPHPVDDITVFLPANIVPARSFSLAQITGPTIVGFATERVGKQITADQAVADSGLEGSDTQILGKRSGKVSTALGEAEAVWVDFLAAPSSRNKQFRGRALYEVRHPGDGATITGGAACVSPPEAFASFDRLCSSALDGYELGAP
jgi:hypothetical protein